MELFNDDCLNILPKLDDNSVDLFFTDLPYGQTACKWDNKIDLVELWKQLNRVCKINCPMIFTTTTKYGVELINSNPKNFRYDLVWVKTAATGFLNAKKMPMRKHEMIYVFYRKLPFYNIADNHTHKFLKENKDISYNLIHQGVYGDEVKRDDRKNKIIYNPPLPTSIIKEDDKKCNTIIRDECKSMYGTEKNKIFIYDENNKLRNSEPRYDPPLPTTILEIKSEKGKHQTQKPTELMEWVLKYYSKEGDVVLDCCMGSGSMGVACKNLKRNFIGIELNEEIFKNAEDRLNN